MHPSFHRLHPYAAFPFIICPSPQRGHFCPTRSSPACAPATVPGDFVAGLPDFAAGPSAFGAVCAFGAIFFFKSCSESTVTRRFVVSESTSRTISAICAFSSSTNCDASYFLCSMSRSFFSHIPVSSQLFSSSSRIRSISSIPVGVAIRFFLSRLI